MKVWSPTAESLVAGTTTASVTDCFSRRLEGCRSHGLALAPDTLGLHLTDSDRLESQVCISWALTLVTSANWPVLLFGCSPPSGWQRGVVVQARLRPLLTPSARRDQWGRALFNVYHAVRRRAAATRVCITSSSRCWRSRRLRHHKSRPSRSLHPRQRKVRNKQSPRITRLVDYTFDRTYRYLLGGNARKLLRALSLMQVTRCYLW